MIDKLFNLKNKTIFLSGGTGYIGSVISLGLAEAGANIIINSRNKMKATKLCKLIRSKGFKASSAVFDITNFKNIDRFFKKNKNLQIDCLINNAYQGEQGNIKLSKSDQYIASYNVSVISSHNLLIAALPSLRKAVKKNKQASVINVASIYGLVSPDQSIYESEKKTNPPYYGASKAALIQWSKYASCEFGSEGIRVNSISPGPFPSKKTQNKNPKLIKYLKKKVPLGRIGSPEELIGIMIFLASNASSYVNGSNFQIDGGWTAW